MVQWLRIHLPMQGDVGLIPGWRTKILHAKGQLNLCAATTEPPATTRKPGHFNKISRMPQLRPDTAKTDFFFFNSIPHLHSTHHPSRLWSFSVPFSLFIFFRALISRHQSYRSVYLLSDIRRAVSSMRSRTLPCSQ